MNGGHWEPIGCRESDALHHTLSILSGTTDMDEGVMSRDWGTKGDVVLLRDKYWNMNGLGGVRCEHLKWTED